MNVNPKAFSEVPLPETIEETFDSKVIDQSAQKILVNKSSPATRDITKIHANKIDNDPIMTLLNIGLEFAQTQVMHLFKECLTRYMKEVLKVHSYSVKIQALLKCVAVISFLAFLILRKK